MTWEHVEHLTIGTYLLWSDGKGTNKTPLKPLGYHRYFGKNPMVQCRFSTNREHTNAHHLLVIVIYQNCEPYILNMNLCMIFYVIVGTLTSLFRPLWWTRKLNAYKEKDPRKIRHKQTMPSCRSLTSKVLDACAYLVNDGS